MIALRVAEIKDIPSIISVALPTWKATYPDMVPPEQIEYILETFYSPTAIRELFEQGWKTVLAEKNGQVVGFACYFRKEGEGNIYRLERLYVLPTSQGDGAGSKLLDAVLQKSLAEGASIIELNVNRKNPAVDFYRRKGFEIVAEVMKSFGPFSFPDYLMHKRVA